MATILPAPQRHGAWPRAGAITIAGRRHFLWVETVVASRRPDLSQACCILVGNRKAPSGPCLGTDRAGLGSC